MEKQMYESLKSILKKFDDLNEQLNDPAVAGDIKKYTKVTQEINDIKEVSLAFRKYVSLEQTISDAKELISMESDPEMIEMSKMEISEAEPQLKPLEEELKILLLPKDKNDSKNVIVEIRGAAGGDEANIFAGDLFDMYKG